MMNPDEGRGMGLIVKTVTKLTLGFILLFGIYTSLTGHLSPGGGFAGGVIVALAFIHIVLAFGKEAALKRLKAKALRAVIGLSGIVFLYIVMTSFSGGCVPAHLIFAGKTACAVFNNEITIPVCETAIVGCGLFAIFIALILSAKHDKDAE